MIDIQEKTKNIMLNGIARFSSRLNKPESDVQILIHTSDKLKGVPLYSVLYKYTKVERDKLYLKEIRDNETNDIIKHDVEFNEITGVKIDIFGMGIIANEFIKNKLLSLSKKEDIRLDNIKIIISKNKNDVDLYLYNNTKFIKIMLLQDMFIKE